MNICYNFTLKLLKLYFAAFKQSKVSEAIKQFNDINPFLAKISILHPLKTPENLWFSGVFRGYKMVARNVLMSYFKSYIMVFTNHSKVRESLDCPHCPQTLQHTTKFNIRIPYWILYF